MLKTAQLNLISSKVELLHIRLKQTVYAVEMEDKPIVGFMTPCRKRSSKKLERNRNENKAKVSRYNIHLAHSGEAGK